MRVSLIANEKSRVKETIRKRSRARVFPARRTRVSPRADTLVREVKSFFWY
jgi:hypothetical protein